MATGPEKAKFIEDCGAGSRTRTDDLLITNQLLYQLSYAGLGVCNASKRRNPSNLPHWLIRSEEA